MSGNWTVIAYRKICDVDRVAAAEKRLGYRRFELHTDLHEHDARSIFETYGSSPQVLAVELYNSDGLVARSDLLMDLLASEASMFDYAKACHSFN